MSHTIIVTPETHVQKIENTRNECKRHCRIGKVKAKQPEGWWPDPLHGRDWQWSHIREFIHQWQFPRGIRLPPSPIDEAMRSPVTWGAYV